MSPTLFFATLVIAALGVGSFMSLDRLAGNRLRQVRRLVDGLNRHFRALTAGVKELKHHAGRRREFLQDEFARGAGELRNQGVAVNSLFTLASNWGQALYLVAIFVYIAIAPRHLALSRGTVAAFTLAALYLSRPLEFILFSLPSLGRARVALETLDALGFALDYELAPPPGPHPAVASIELKGVVYTYRRPGQVDFTLGPIDLRLAPGEIVFLVGGNGSGKTTLAKLVGGLYPPARGQILLNGAPVEPLDDAYAQLFSAIYADSYVFDSLVAAVKGDERWRRILALLRLEEKVDIDDGRLSTTELSQGQRKRILMLMALLEDRPIYIFDEWAAEQDPEFRDVFYREILPSLRSNGKGVLVISHDDRYFGVADRVMRLDYGALIDHDLSPASLAPKGAAPILGLQPVKSKGLV